MSVISVDEVRRRPRALRLTFDPVVLCPAGVPIFESLRGSGVQCSIERNPIVSHDDPSSLMNYCCNRYDLCPSWREEKHRIDEGTVQPLAEREDRVPSREEVLGVQVERPEEVEVTWFEGG